jgi:hypothetical protein
MNEQSPLSQEVQALRSAAEEGGWNQCRAATEVLLLRLPTSRAVQLARDFIADRLPVFERQQPGVLWPRELLGAVREKGSSSRERIWPEEDEFSGPGGNSFKKAVESLWHGSLRTDDTRQCTADMVDAISSAIMAERVEHWGSRHPKEWALWYELALSGESDPRMTDIQLAMLKDPALKRLKRDAWLELAERLEAALREP